MDELLKTLRAAIRLQQQGEFARAEDLSPALAVLPAPFLGIRHLGSLVRRAGQLSQRTRLFA